MKAVIPIGGGEISNQSTLQIDKYILGLVNKAKPKILFVPIASNDYKDYIEKFSKYYSELGCEVDILALTYMENDNLIRSKIFSSDVIYIGGGNTGKMNRVFKRTHVNEYLKEAYERGIILTGLSAGAMAYFANGYSDCNRSTDINASLTEVKCIGIINYCFCPHYNEQGRETFDDFVINKGYTGIALDNDCALVYIDDQIKGIIKSNINAKGYLISSKGKEVIGEL